MLGVWRGNRTITHEARLNLFQALISGLDSYSLLTSPFSPHPHFSPAMAARADVAALEQAP